MDLRCLVIILQYLPVTLQLDIILLRMLSILNNFKY